MAKKIKKKCRKVSLGRMRRENDSCICITEVVAERLFVLPSRGKLYDATALWLGTLLRHLVKFKRMAGILTRVKLKINVSILFEPWVST